MNDEEPEGYRAIYVTEYRGGTGKKTYIRKKECGRILKAYVAKRQEDFKNNRDRLFSQLADSHLRDR